MRCAMTELTSSTLAGSGYRKRRSRAPAGDFFRGWRIGCGDWMLLKGENCGGKSLRRWRGGVFPVEWADLGAYFEWLKAWVP